MASSYVEGGDGFEDPWGQWEVYKKPVPVQNEELLSLLCRQASLVLRCDNCPIVKKCDHLQQLDKPILCMNTMRKNLGIPEIDND